MMTRSLLAGLVMGLVLATAGGEAQPKKRLAVARFADAQGYASSGVGVADMLSTALVKTGKFMVIERKELEKVMQEQRLGASELVTPETAPQIGRLLGVDLLVIGSISEFGTKKREVSGGISLFGAGVSHKQARAAVDIRLVNTTTGEIVIAETREGTESSVGIGVRYEDINFSDLDAWDDTDLGKAAREAVNGCVELLTENMARIPWSGRILKANADGTVLMKPGSEGNVAAGMEFDVYRRGEELKDPDTGLTLGFDEKKVGRIKVKEDILSGKACKAVVLEGSGFDAGDIVREAAE